MITTKKQLKSILKNEKKQYRNIGYKGNIHTLLTNCEIGYIWNYIKLLRKEEYYLYIQQKNICYKLIFFINRRKKNKLGLKLGMNIPPNVFGEGLLIYHANGIVVNKNAKIGKNCKLHGQNCIGNNGKNEMTPILGDNVDIGIGAKIIGGIKIGNNVIIGANSVVIKNFQEDNIIVAGVPALKK